jgi:hypothetical protein
VYIPKPSGLFGRATFLLAAAALNFLSFLLTRESRIA